jgi:glycosyltransferase involved in cell wall biosynthesis
MSSFVSIVVPAYDAEPFLGRCIESLLALEYPADRLEIIVVDNASNDRTPAIISGYPVMALAEPRPGAAAARNRGIAHARGAIVAFTDADCEVDPTWLSEIDRALADPELGAVMGFAEGSDDNFWACLEQRNFEAFWFRDDERGLGLRRHGIDTRNCAIRKAVLEACGYLNAELMDCEDLDLGVRMRQRGVRIGFNEKMRVRHRNRTALAPILRVKRNHARAFVKIVEQQPSGLDCPELPCDYRTFLGVDNRSIEDPMLAAAQAVFGTLRLAILACLRCLAALRVRPEGMALKLFKTLCDLTWEVEILKARRRRGIPRTAG